MSKYATAMPLLSLENHVHVFEEAMTSCTCPKLHALHPDCVLAMCTPSLKSALPPFLPFAEPRAPTRAARHEQQGAEKNIACPQVSSSSCVTVQWPSSLPLTLRARSQQQPSPVHSPTPLVLHDLLQGSWPSGSSTLSLIGKLATVLNDPSPPCGQVLGERPPCWPQSRHRD